MRNTQESPLPTITGLRIRAVLGAYSIICLVLR